MIRVATFHCFLKNVKFSICYLFDIEYFELVWSQANKIDFANNRKSENIITGLGIDLTHNFFKQNKLLEPLKEVILKNIYKKYIVVIIVIVVFLELMKLSKYQKI